RGGGDGDPGPADGRCRRRARHRPDERADAPVGAAAPGHSAAPVPRPGYRPDRRSARRSAGHRDRAHGASDRIAARGIFPTPAPGELTMNDDELITKVMEPLAQARMTTTLD